MLSIPSRDRAKLSSAEQKQQQKQHFRQGLHHNITGVKLSWGVLTSAAYVLREKNHKMKRRSEERRKLAAVERQRKTEEKARREKELLEKAETTTLADRPPTGVAAE